MRTLPALRQAFVGLVDGQTASVSCSRGPIADDLLTVCGFEHGWRPTLSDALEWVEGDSSGDLTGWRLAPRLPSLMQTAHRLSSIRSTSKGTGLTTDDARP